MVNLLTEMIVSPRILRWAKDLSTPYYNTILLYIRLYINCCVGFLFYDLLLVK